jgi:hypothetical protein
MQAKWDDIVFLVLGSLSFGILWWLSVRLRDPRFGRFMWGSFNPSGGGSHAAGCRAWEPGPLVSRQKLTKEDPCEGFIRNLCKGG